MKEILATPQMLAHNDIARAERFGIKMFGIVCTVLPIIILTTPFVLLVLAGAQMNIS
jgi:hypothetical protein